MMRRHELNMDSLGQVMVSFVFLKWNKQSDMSTMSSWNPSNPKGHGFH